MPTVAPTNGSTSGLYETDRVGSGMPPGSLFLQGAATLARGWRRVIAIALTTTAVGTLAAALFPK
nr:hypothetical protein [Candidatus Eremiobacteraeota bacterium]